MTALRFIDRLRRMPASEIAGRVRTKVRNDLQRVSWSIARPRWRRRDLARALEPGHAAMQEVRPLLERSDFAGAHAALAGHFYRRAPLFVLSPGQRDSLARAIRARFPSAAANATRRADRILAGRLDLLGYMDLDVTGTAERGAPIDWHRDPVHDRRAPARHWASVPYLDPAYGDHKVIWELNRHQHWLALGRAYALSGSGKYRDRALAELSSWMAANPPLTGVNWSSMLELSIRALSWIWALHFFVEEDESTSGAAWLVDLLLGLDRQLRLVEGNLSTYFSPNTHLLGEALALYAAGRSLPELKRARRWAALGRATLIREAAVQIGEDGGHAELSLHYHRYALDFYLLALAVARTSGDTAAVPPFEASVRSMARFARAIADDSYRLASLGDDDGGMLLPMCGRDEHDVRDSLALAAVMTGADGLFEGEPPETVAWMSGTVHPPVTGAGKPASAALIASGYVVSRTGGDHLVMDAGRHGFLNGGHAHADALSLTLTVAGTPLLIDPGTACYTIDQATRDRFRSTPFHNTIVVDGRSQSIPAGPFQWTSTADATLHAWRSDAAFDFCEASHDGYRPIVHARQVLSRPGCWIVWDWLLGGSVGEAALHWHLAPGWSASQKGRAICLDHQESARVWLWILGADDIVFHSAESDSAGLGWYAPSYGAVVPTTTIRATCAGAPATALTTVILEAADEVPAVRPVAVAGTRAAAIELQSPSWKEIALARAPIVYGERETPGTLVHAGGYESDGRAVIVREHASGPSEIWMVDGSTVRQRDGHRLLSLRSAVPVVHAPARSGTYRGSAEVPTPDRVAGSARVRSKAGRAIPAGR